MHIKVVCNRKSNSDARLERVFSKCCLWQRISNLTQRHRLTEHGFEPNQTADEAVEVDVHALVGVAHGDDVVQLVVETEA